MEFKKFINNLSQNNANYNNPEQAITTANLCETISRDINTDSQRFIYELIQNADDASNNSGSLDIRIDFVDEYIVVSHKGEPFSKIDIESISSAGDGTKSDDSNKTGFKGIGFKSVFSHSNFVIIKSGDYCFKFDKQHWVDHWNNVWGSQSIWRSERKTKNKDVNIKMPWQIIPIWTELPVKLKNLSVINEYNVSTIIRYDKIEQIKKAFIELFSESQIVLFLRSKHVKVFLNTDEKLLLEKSVSGEITCLKRNDRILSEWLVKTELFAIPENVQEEINADEKSPKKLKEAQRTEISFAIQIDKGKLKPVEKENRLIFTYLPTSINYDFPFLVNASFLTDAGRQHLHYDTFWNQWLFTQIPIIYFGWISKLADKSSKFNSQFLTVLPQKLNGFSELENKFNDGFDEAINTIAFIPNIKGDLLKVSDALFDETNISDFISKQSLLNYINIDANNKFTISSFIPSLKPINTLKQLGLYIFKIDRLEGFFISEVFSKEHRIEENFKLISFLHKQSNENQKNESENNWNYRLRTIPFIFDENEILQKPELIYFPAVEFSADFTDDISIINKSVLVDLDKNKSIKNWLEELGVKEPNDVNFIEKTIIGDSEFINEENAIKIGRYLFNTNKKGKLTDFHYSKLHHINILTQKGNLKQAQDCFLSDFYEPVLRLEKVSDIDFFVSENYYEINDLKSEWKAFFLKIGLNEDVEWSYQTIKFDYQNEWKNRFDQDYLEQIWDESRKYSWVAWDGWDKNGKGYGFYPNEITFKGLPFIKYATEYDFSKMFFQRIFDKEIPELENHIAVSGKTGMIWRSLYLNNDDLKTLGGFVNYTKWVINNIAIFPVDSKECKKASDVFNNNITLIKEISGKYLPVLDYSLIISEKWQEILKFKEQLRLDDYLSILTEIWQDSELTEEEQKENKKRVLLIYQKLAELFPNLHALDKNKLKNWSNSNKLLARDGKFHSPNVLSIVTIDGFNANNLIYTENKVDESIINLFDFWGVKVIDKVTPKFSKSMVTQEDLRQQLEYIAPLIALVAVEKSKNNKEWEEEYNRICRKLSDITFYATTEILLTYGSEEDQQQRSTYSEGNKFFYVGNWYKPRVLDGLIEPLCKFINIRYAERILTVLLTDVFLEGLKYLEEKGFDTSLIPDNLKNPKYEERVPNQINRPYNPSDEDLGKKGELFVFEELKRIYIKKYNQQVEDTEQGFKIGDYVNVIWRNISENTSTNHDFKIIENKNEIYIDSKATPFDKNREKIALYISGNELNLMEAAEKYLIARVYNVLNENPCVEFIRMNLENFHDINSIESGKHQQAYDEIHRKKNTYLALKNINDLINN